MMVPDLIILLCVLAQPNAGTKSFIASFQSSGKWSKDEWLEYTGKFPPLVEFTVCHWEKVQYFSTGINTVWAYCLFATKNESRMKCVEVFHRGNSIPSTVGGNTDFVGWINGWTDSTIYADFINVSYRHREWNHFCWSYSSITGINKAYHNGKLINTISLMEGY